ncbi:histidine utilization repressor [Vibrio sp. SCSIO 43136]|uniref:histidine utilization repressor n=1 Tax=Vibrio sp. SCSIO 43136 TaxID=2819101 RepID=UPI0020766056|nr:histidine utilization repressor [Vibrio sp. SCSIO 43136]USD64119.1 histidine utilization repressor [Vibrio sp. SCSIO 43136]
MKSPRYVQIRDYIDQKIQSGQWPAGTQITTELELTKQFDVSRMTVNKAIRDLVNAGKLERTPRRGTFVCQPQHKAESPLLRTTNIAFEVTSRQQKYHAQILKVAETKADETIATKLGVMIGSQVFVSQIVHFADGVPIQLEKRWINAQLAPNYLEQDFTAITPHQYLSDNCPLTALEHTVEALIAKSDIRHHLQIDDSEPCLLLNRRTWSGSDLVSFAKLYHPASRYKLTSKVDL